MDDTDAVERSTIILVEVDFPLFDRCMDAFADYPLRCVLCAGAEGPELVAQLRPRLVVAQVAPEDTDPLRAAAHEAGAELLLASVHGPSHETIADRARSLFAPSFRIRPRRRGSARSLAR
jgi:hypothetical protein